MNRRHAALPKRALIRLVSVLSIAVAVAGTQMPAVAEPVTSSAESSGSDTTSRPDAVSAMVTARMTGERVEDLSQRSETTQVFANPDGTWTSESATEPERVQDEQGSWRDVDTTLAASEDGVAPVATTADLRLSGGGDRVFAALTDRRGKRVEWQWPTELPTPVLDGDTATYVDALPGVGDLVVTATSTGFTHHLVLPRRPMASVKLTIPVAARGARLVKNPGGEVAVETPAGDTLVASARPLMWDSSTNVGGDPEVAAVETRIGRSAAGIPTMTLAPDAAFLAAPTTVYPVIVDPSFTINPSGDTWVQYPNYTSSQSGSGELKVGTYDGGGHKARSFLRFDNGDAKWSGVHVLDAKLKLRNYYSGSCTGSAIRVSRITEPWTVSGLTWGNQPSVGAMSDDFSPAKGYNSTCDAGDATWDMTEIVQGWSGNLANHGVRIKAVDEGSNFTWRRYRSANYGTTSLRPRLSVTYNSYPNKTGTPTVSPGNTGFTTSTTPTFKSKVSDPNGGTVRAIFEVYQGSTLKWTGTSAYVSSGSAATKTIGSGILTNGTAYTVKVKASDGTDTSKSYSTSTAFTVDTSKPTAAVSASAFTNGQWTTEVPASNTFTFNGPADTKSFTYALDAVTQPAKTADSNGDATISWLPKSGSHKLTVTPTDKAGNVGPASTFSFGTGPASFTTPNQLTRSTSVFPINISGPPNATSATLSWRYSGKSTWNDADGITSNGSPWSGAVANAADNSASTSGQLLWNASLQDDSDASEGTITAPALIELRACFSYTGTPSQVCSTTPRQLQLVRSAFEENLPVAQAGPATVALLTGEMRLTEADAVDTAAGMGRTFATFDPATTAPGAFGPGWSTSLFSGGDTTAQLIDRRTQDRSMVLVTSGGSSETFVPVDPAVDPSTASETTPVDFELVAGDDLASLRLTDTAAVLTRDQGAVTRWERDATGAWEIVATRDQTTAGDDPEVAITNSGAGYPTWIAQTEPGVATTCTAATQTAGCRGLKLHYTADGDRVTRIDKVVGGATPTTSTLATYTYTDGLLTSVCGPDPDGGGSQVPLCASYAYDSTTVAGRTLLERITPPGQAPWEFTYDATGRLNRVSRPLATASGTGDAQWTVAYDLSPAATGLPDLTSAEEWGQTTTPAKAYAVFSPNHVPSATPTGGDLERARVFYVDETGQVTNTAVHGNVGGAATWLLDTFWYDTHGNVVRHLDGAGRARVLSDPDTTAPRPGGGSLELHSVQRRR